MGACWGPAGVSLPLILDQTSLQSKAAPSPAPTAGRGTPDQPHWEATRKAQKFVSFVPGFYSGEEEAGEGIDLLDLLVLMKQLTVDLPQQYHAPSDNSPDSKLFK